MGLTGETFDAIRIDITTKGGATFDLDNILLLDPTGSSALGTTIYTMAPPTGLRYYVNGFLFNMAGPLAGTVADGTMPGISYNKFLNINELDSPIIFQVYNTNNVIFSTGFTKIADFFLFGSPEFRFTGSDGTNTWICVYIGLSSPIVLNGNENDRITLTMSEDFSPLTLFRFGGNVESISLPEKHA
jgi:hypothetical protein